MKKNWKQQTPADEMVAVYASMEGWFSNWVSGITPNEEFTKKMMWHLNEIHELLPYLQGKQEWVPFYGKK